MDPAIDFYYNTGMPTELLQNVMTQGKVGLVLGHRQAGKTTAALQAIREGLSQGLAAHYVSLQRLTVRSQRPSKLCAALLPLCEGADLRPPPPPPGM